MPSRKGDTVRILTLVFVFASHAFAQEIHCKHFFGGMPTGVAESNDLIFRDLYVLSSNDDRKFADWVAYRLTAEETFGTLVWSASGEMIPGSKRTKRSKPDPLARTTIEVLTPHMPVSIDGTPL
jgi:hypothetical protein